MAAGRRTLLDDDEGDHEVAPQLRVNEAYAKRLEHNKRREDSHRLQELEKRGLANDSDDSSSEEEDDDGLLPVRTEEKIFETLAKIKKRDPSIYSAETKFFDDADDDEDSEEEKLEVKPKKQKPLYLKDVNARQLLDGSAEEDEDELVKSKPPKNYFTEQEELKRAFLKGVREADGEDGDELLVVKKRTKEELDREKKEIEEAVAEAELRQKDAGVAKKLEEYFGKDVDLNDSDRFLKEYLLNKGWIDEDRKRFPKSPDDLGIISEDEEELNKQDKYEADYNFRFQEGDNTYVKGHSRIIDDSVRKKPETRKKQRESKKDRQLEEERSRQEDLKRLKNVKKSEILEKLSKIRKIAGVGAGAEVLGEDDLEEDFDPLEYDKKMKEAFGEEYYGAEDPDFIDGEDDDLEKSDFYAEDELVGIEPEESAGFAAAKAKLAQAPKLRLKVKVPFEEKLMIDKHLEEYYKLDYEDVIGDLPTRFKYTQVNPNKYGLKTKEILGLDDKELNQFVSLKKLAPYTAEEWKPRGPVPRLSKKGRMKKALKGEDAPTKLKMVRSDYSKKEDSVGVDITSEKSDSSKTRARDDSQVQHGNGDSHANGGEVGAERDVGSKKKKKKRKKSLTPLPMPRMLTYLLPIKKVKR